VVDKEPNWPMFLAPVVFGEMPYLLKLKLLPNASNCSVLALATMGKNASKGMIFSYNNPYC
jgi:hypothetical protein